jgi:hypothetical protein
VQATKEILNFSRDHSVQDGELNRWLRVRFKHVAICANTIGEQDSTMSRRTTWA